ncbi:aspartate/glutamate racemase family protein [Calorimonas adulescens]|jgi:Asp/Glu/Hydantoin racemase.|uniref:Hydantoin racemase n=1 Tax=Calorimonas adulescens TaxID=2606906 RepID=A0A5D8QFJ0_9THEO|nr:aspartate/glutamate racemase family protein [Calorimonas adulescens]TZE82293.1 hydantoin racemase [Calorimonas adulescens]
MKLSMYKIGLIRVLTTYNDKILNAHGKILEKLIPDFRVISRCIEDQPYGIYDSISEKIAVPKIIRLGEKLASEGVDAIIVSCAADPAVKELRMKLNMQVIGAGSACAALAIAAGERIGTLGITEDTPEAMKEILGHRLTGEAKPTGIRNTVDLMNDDNKIHLLRAANELIEKGADVIAFACTGLSTIGALEYLKNNIKFPVIDAVIASGVITYGILTRKGNDGLW